jgi:pilus assembly protein Flp/PilA
MTRAVVRFLRDESAPSMVEYGLLIALVAMVVAVAAVSLGSSVSGLFNTTASSV